MQFLILWIIHKNVINGEWALIYSHDRGLIMLRNIKFLNVLPCWVSTVCPLYFYSSRHPCFIRFWILLDQCLQIMKFLSKLLVFIVYWIIEFSFYITITVSFHADLNKLMQIGTSLAMNKKNNCKGSYYKFKTVYFFSTTRRILPFSDFY